MTFSLMSHSLILFLVIQGMWHFFNLNPVTNQYEQYRIVYQPSTNLVAYPLSTSWGRYGSSGKLSASGYGAEMDMDSSGQVLAVGCISRYIFAPWITRPGAVYIYEHDGSDYAYRQELTEPELEDYAQFGMRIEVSRDGEMIFIASRARYLSYYYNSGSHTFNAASNWVGGVYMFVKGGLDGSGGQSYVVEQFIKSAYPFASNEFGSGLALSPDQQTLYIGEAAGATPDQVGVNDGVVHIYSRNETGLWNIKRRVYDYTADGPGTSGHSALLGTSVAISYTGILVAGAPNTEFSKGAVYVFYNVSYGEDQNCPDACQNGGICKNGLCDCTNANGIGITCENALPCSSSPCLHAGTCANSEDNLAYICDCTNTGFSGMQCETNIDDCDSAPCVNGECTDDISSFQCNCTNTGYEGFLCETMVNACSSSPCTASTVCSSDDTGAYTCTETDPCLSNPCLNGAVCSSSEGILTCTDQDGSTTGWTSSETNDDSSTTTVWTSSETDDASSTTIWTSSGTTTLEKLLTELNFSMTCETQCIEMTFFFLDYKNDVTEEEFLTSLPVQLAATFGGEEEDYQYDLHPHGNGGYTATVLLEDRGSTEDPELAEFEAWVDTQVDEKTDIVIIVEGEAQAEEDDPPKENNDLLMIIIVVLAIVVVASLGIGAWYYNKSKRKIVRSYGQGDDYRMPV